MGDPTVRRKPSKPAWRRLPSACPVCKNTFIKRKTPSSSNHILLSNSKQAVLTSNSNSSNT